MRCLAASVSTVSGTGVGEFFDAYFNRVGGMLESWFSLNSLRQAWKAIADRFH
jgi:hypothetical protein